MGFIFSRDRLNMILTEGVTTLSSISLPDRRVFWGIFLIVCLEEGQHVSVLGQCSQKTKYKPWTCPSLEKHRNRHLCEILHTSQEVHGFPEDYPWTSFKNHTSLVNSYSLRVPCNQLQGKEQQLDYLSLVDSL